MTPTSRDTRTVTRIQDEVSVISPCKFSSLLRTSDFSVFVAKQYVIAFSHEHSSVDDVEKTCERFEQMGVRFKKRPSDGKMRHIAFILDEDNYWIEVVPKKMSL